MNNLQKEVERELLIHTLGVSEGYSIIDIPTYFQNEYFTNEAHRGGRVPEDFYLREERHLVKNKKEKEIWMRQFQMQAIEAERIDPCNNRDPDKKEEAERLKCLPQREWETNEDYLPNEIVKL